MRRKHPPKFTPHSTTAVRCTETGSATTPAGSAWVQPLRAEQGCSQLISDTQEHGLDRTFSFWVKKVLSLLNNVVYRAAWFAVCVGNDCP